MSENNEKIKGHTYIKNGKYLFTLIKIIPHSPNNVEKIGITIYKKNLEINILNKDCIDTLINNNSKFVESYANIGFINICGILCFIFASNNDIKEKEKIVLRNNILSYKIYKIKKIHCCILTYSFPEKVKKRFKKELDKIEKFFIAEELFFSNSPYRYDYDISNQLEIFEDNKYKYKLNEKYQYNEDFSLNIFENLLTPVVKGFYKHISYNNLFNDKDKDRMNISIRYKINGNDKYLIEVEMFMTPNVCQKYFQIIFYAYFNESEDKYIYLKKIIDNWLKDNNNNNKSYKNEGIIINYFCNLKQENKNNEFIEEISGLKNFEIINIKKSNGEIIDNILNANIEKLKNVGYNYKFNNIDYNSQNQILIICGDNYENLFSFLKIIAYKMYGIFLNDRGYQKNIINNSKDEIIKHFKNFEKKIHSYKTKFPRRMEVQFVKDENAFKNLFEFVQNEDSKTSINFNIGNKEFIMVDSEKKENKEFVIIDTLEHFEKEKNDTNETHNENNEDNNNIEDDNIESNNDRDENNNNIYDNINENENNIIDDDLYENNNNVENKNIDYNGNNLLENNNINEILIKNNNININKKKKNCINIFIGTFNVNALEIDLIKKIDLDLFLFPEKIKNYFYPENIPIFYCIGLEETIELNPKNVLIKPKNKAEQWEERISEELQKRYNYFLICREQLVGVLLLIFTKASEVKHISNIHLEKYKFGFMGCGNKGCCFFDFEYKKKSYGFCSCHLPAGQNKKNFLDRKETFRHILEFKVNKNIYEFYKNDFFFIFGDLNFRTKKLGLVELQNHIKIIMGENKYKAVKKKKSFRFSFDFSNKKVKNKTKDKDKEEEEKKKQRKNLQSDNLFEIKIPDNIESRKIKEVHKINKSTDKKIDKNKKDKEDYHNYYTNNNSGNEIKQCNMDENNFIQYFFKDFLEDEELKKLKENELYSYNLNEAEITFPPTYKYVKGTNFYNLEKRVPSWTDRILYSNVEQITPIYYDRININFSDHKPIVGLYEINIEE